VSAPLMPNLNQFNPFPTLTNFSPGSCPNNIPLLLLLVCRFSHCFPTKALYHILLSHESYLPSLPSFPQFYTSNNTARGARWRSWLKHYATNRNVAGSPIPVAVRSKAWVCGRSLSRIVGSNPPIPVAVRSKAWVCGRSLTRIVGSNPPIPVAVRSKA
jgi:hypothetical protein